MKAKDLEYILQTLEYDLNECDDELEDKSTHFNLFANSISLVKEELSLSKEKIKSSLFFDGECEMYIDKESDEWVLKHKGVIKKRAKSKFECLLVKQQIKKDLGV